MEEIAGGNPSADVRAATSFNVNDEDVSVKAVVETRTRQMIREEVPSWRRKRISGARSERGAPGEVTLPFVRYRLLVLVLVLVFARAQSLPIFNRCISRLLPARASSCTGGRRGKTGRQEQKRTGKKWKINKFKPNPSSRIYM